MIFNRVTYNCMKLVLFNIIRKNNSEFYLIRSYEEVHSRVISKVVFDWTFPHSFLEP